MKKITIALSKGRLADRTVELFKAAGYDFSLVQTKTRKLVLEDEKNGFAFIMAKPSDVPTYVDYGVADIGVVGKDTLMEEGRNLYEVLDLGFARCRLCVCGFPHQAGKLEQIANKKVATKYPNVARRYFETSKREGIEIIKLNGSVELAPIVGLSDIIVDIVESGKTLKENGLEVLEDIAEISARLVVNRVSMRMKSDRIRPMILALEKELKKRESGSSL